jgi:hypothetical protein
MTMNERYKHVYTGRRLGAKEAARVRQMREQHEREKADIIARAKAKLGQIEREATWPSN